METRELVRQFPQQSFQRGDGGQGMGEDAARPVIISAGFPHGVHFRKQHRKEPGPIHGAQRDRGPRSRKQFHEFFSNAFRRGRCQQAMMTPRHAQAFRVDVKIQFGPKAEQSKQT